MQSIPDFRSTTHHFRPTSFMPDVDFFNFFRWVAGTVASVYATVITLQSLHGWYAWLAGQDKYMSLVRRYVIVHGLRLRVRAFWADVLICVLLCVAFGLLWRAHILIYDLGDTLQSLHGRHIGHS
jgi:hypothetical protein